MSVLRIRLWIAFCVAFFVLAPVVSILLGVNLHARDMQYIQLDRPDFPGRTVAFEVVLVAADPKHGILRMDWKIVEEENSACNADNLDACTPVNIFFDTNLLRPEGAFSTQEAIMTSERPRRPLFVFNAAGFATKDVRAQRPIFRTQLALFSEGEHPSSLLYYPFDRYTSELVFFAEEATTNATLGVKVKRTGGVAVGFEAIVSHKTDRVVPPEVVEALITLTRSTLVKSYSVVATLAIWVVTIILALVMITSVFFGFKQRPEVLLIPVATLFAFTTLRQSMPGAPEGFGDVIDLVGLVPCLALLALTAALSLGVFLLSDPSATTRTLRWKNMRKPYRPFEARSC
ncbi:hypothetical protein BKA70DRAFT_1098864 [Coprinopsis sp. MPI-PUGE-AT-0042]|nr:hypothetical protein BKA70DRAFT_1098864 [Coprinopsis sp. MPI-PUGE-AT-0042]